MTRPPAIPSAVLPSYAYPVRCTAPSKRQKGKKHIPLNSYVSLYEESEVRRDGKKLPLIDTIGTEKESDPAALYFSREYTEIFIEQLKEKLSPLENHVLYLHLM